MLRDRERVGGGGGGEERERERRHRHKQTMARLSHRVVPRKQRKRESLSIACPGCAAMDKESRG